MMPPAHLLNVLRFSQSVQMDLPALRSSCSYNHAYFSKDHHLTRSETLPGAGFFTLAFVGFFMYLYGNRVLEMCQHSIKFCGRDLM